MKGVSALNITEGISLITFNRAPDDRQFLPQALAEFSRRGINIDMISQTAPQGDTLSLSWTISDADVIPALEAIKYIRSKYPSVLPLVSGGNCKIQLFGEDMRNMSGVAAKAIEAVCKAGSSIIMITTSEVDISFLIPPASIEESCSALREVFSL